MQNLKTDKHLILCILVLAVCFVLWLCARISFLYMYQMPTRQTVHPNYLTFHEMSVSLDEGKQLGTINVGRMARNGKRDLMSNYDMTQLKQDVFCNYLTLDPGYAYIVSAARHSLTFMTDSYLSSVVFQFIFDGLLLFLLFATFLRWGLGPATLVTALFAINPTFAYNTVQPFANFWEGMLTALAVFAIIWARRFLADRRNFYGIMLLITAGLLIGFGVWVRATLAAAGVLMAVFLFLAPATRRHASIFVLIFALMIMPQIMRASSVAGHFATSTRLVWHTALHGLGHYPNAYGIFDDDIYSFYTAHDKYSVTYNYCDYRQHDLALKDYYLKFAKAHPAFVTRVIISRIINNIYFNFTEGFSVGWNYLLVALAGIGVTYALLVGGELLFVAALVLPLYLGLNAAIGMIYYIQPAYASLTQLCLILLAMLAVPALLHGGRVLRQRFQKHRPVAQQYSRWAWRRALVFALLMIGFSVALCLPPLHDYVFMQEAWAPYWQPPQPLARKELEDVITAWQKLPKMEQDKFMAYIHKYVPTTANAAQDINAFVMQRWSILGYFDRGAQEMRKFLTAGGLAVELMSGLHDVSASVIGWKIAKVTAIDITKPETWDGRQLAVTLEPRPERAQSDYKQFAIDKLRRWNWAVTWLDDNNFVATHIPKGCDELRQRLAFFYNGYCPKESYEEINHIPVK